MRACANASSNTLAQAVHRALRNVLEAEMAARVMRRECYAPMHTYHAVARALPFVQESNTALGKGAHVRVHADAQRSSQALC
jgi:hypothetical protein